jgi:hypothetical protein
MQLKIPVKSGEHPSVHVLAGELPPDHFTHDSGDAAARLHHKGTIVIEDFHCPATVSVHPEVVGDTARNRTVGAVRSAA